MKKRFILLIISAFLLNISGCSAKLRDGVYEGRSTDDTRGAYGIVSIRVTGGKIASVEYMLYNADGTIKGEKYGEEAGEENYKIAQESLKKAQEYEKKLVETQDVEKVDVVTGATTAWKQFQEAARDALAKAR